MPLLLTEADVRAILTHGPHGPLGRRDLVPRLGDGAGVSHPRRRLLIPGKTILNYMAASDAAGATWA